MRNFDSAVLGGIHDRIKVIGQVSSPRGALNRDLDRLTFRRCDTAFGGLAPTLLFVEGDPHAAFESTAEEIGVHANLDILAATQRVLDVAALPRRRGMIELERFREIVSRPLVPRVCRRRSQGRELRGRVPRLRPVAEVGCVKGPEAIG